MSLYATGGVVKSQAGQECSDFLFIPSLSSPPKNADLSKLKPFVEMFRFQQTFAKTPRQDSDET